MFVYYKCYIPIELTVSQRIESASKKFDICHYWYYLNEDFKFQPNV